MRDFQQIIPDTIKDFAPYVVAVLGLLGLGCLLTWFIVWTVGK